MDFCGGDARSEPSTRGSAITFTWNISVRGTTQANGAEPEFEGRWKGDQCVYKLGDYRWHPSGYVQVDRRGTLARNSILIRS